MPRQSRRSGPAAGPTRRGDPGAGPFAALAGLKHKPAAGPAATAKTNAVAAQRGAAPAAPPGEEDLRLFRREVAGAQPIRDGGRAELERPRPAPVPRPRVETPEDAPRALRRTDEDPLREAYAGVTPLRDTGRVALPPPPKPRRDFPGDDGRAPPTDSELPPVLPAEADHADPSALFRELMRGTRPLDTGNRVELAPPAPPPAPIKREQDEAAALNESLHTPLSFEDRLDSGDETAFLRPGLPRRVLTDLRRRRWTLQGEVDLHGFTREEAREALARFLALSLQQGRRCVRVIHGKGLGSPGKVSILKQLSRGWLAQREEILAFCQAGPNDGGSGALLVLLRAPSRPPDA